MRIDEAVNNEHIKNDIEQLKFVLERKVKFIEMYTPIFVILTLNTLMIVAMYIINNNDYTTAGKFAFLMFMAWCVFNRYMKKPRKNIEDLENRIDELYKSLTHKSCRDDLLKKLK